MQALHYLNKEEKALLLKSAMEAIEHRKELEPDNVPQLLKEKHGAFVSLHKDGELRGCIGYLLPTMPLFKAVIKAALAAAYEDSRFEPLSKDELKGLEVEISVLTVLVAVEWKNEKELFSKINKKGVILQKDYRSATFLPQVWEQLPEKEEFLAHLCLKAGLSPDAWKKGAKIQTYEAEIFSGKF